MYSWNHKSGDASPAAEAAAATSSMPVAAIVDSVYGSPCRVAERAAPDSPSGCSMRV